MKSKYLVVGASGYIGSMMVSELISRNEEVTVIVRDTKRLSAYIADNVRIVQADITNRELLLRITEKYDYIIHCAAPTKSAYMISNPVEVINTIVNGTDNILDLARRCDAKSIIYLSSMEVYGQIECTGEKRITENELGFIDLSSIRSCYPEAKRMAENLCYSYCKEYGVPVKVARLAQVFGRGVQPNDNRVFAQFAQAVKNNTDIILHTIGDSMGNYCDLDDTVNAILYILKYGEDGEAYNVVNEVNTMTIGEMAKLVSNNIARGKIKVIYDIPRENEYGYAPKTGLRLSGEKLKKLGWEATVSLEEMYRKMLQE